MNTNAIPTPISVARHWAAAMGPKWAVHQAQGLVGIIGPSGHWYTLNLRRPPHHAPVGSLGPVWELGYASAPDAPDDGAWERAREVFSRL